MRLKISQLVIFWLLIIAAQAQPVANFSAAPVSGCAPLVVNFSDQSTGVPTAWTWDLGNGTTSILKNPSVTYLYPGVYRVRLTATNAAGNNTIVKDSFIRVYAAPVVNFSVSSRTGCIPQTVLFRDSSTCIGGTITNWEWDFGDGTLSNQQNPSHVYNQSGPYNITLRVTSSNGCTKTLVRTGYINMYEGVDAAFSINRSNSCTLPVLVDFTNQTTGAGAIRYLWSFGDGSTSTDQNPTHIYSQSGSYSIRLVATNSYGCKDTSTIPNGIRLGTITPDFSSTAVACQNSTTVFRNISTPTPVSSSWYFGDNSSAFTLNADHNYLNAGTYTVKLVSDFGACRDSVIKQITVHPSPTALFTALDTVSCKFPFTSNFINQSGPGLTYSWNFGDGTGNAAATNPTHTYTSEGSYSVSLIATDIIGCKDTAIRTSYINIKLPVVSIDNLPREGCAPFFCQFNTQLLSSEPAISYHWDFGDGDTSNLPNPSHMYDSGVYNIKLIIITASGCTDTLYVPAAIKVGKKPIADFYGNPLNVCANTPVYFYDLTRDTATRWEWDFGDGATGSSQNPYHIYSDTGLFTVQLIAYNNGCSDTMIKQDYVHIDPPIAQILMNFSCTDKYLRNFIGDSSIGADTYLWEFGDGTTSTQANPSHVYASIGVYEVILTVYNNRTGCESVRRRRVIIADEHADFRVSDSVLCKNTAFTFTTINSNPNYISGYLWNFGDNTTGNGRSTSHSYPNAGNYTVSLIITDSVGCMDTMIRNQTLRVNGPTADFSANMPGTCTLSDVLFSDSSYSDGINPIVTRSWNFGDGQTGNGNAAGTTHAYTNPGYYTVSLTVTDRLGCTDSKTIRNIVQVTKPIARFISPDTITCPGKTVRFTNSSAGIRLRYFWNFGDGSTDTLTNPTHVFAADGYYTITLRVTDINGCTDSITKSRYIRVVTGNASFIPSDTFSLCPPLLVNFTNTSSNGASYTWDFGDGTRSQLSNPSHFYAEAGIYTATLTSKGIGGCSTTFSRRIEINGPSGRFSYAPLEGCSPLQVRFTAQTKNCSNIIWDFSDGVTLSTRDTVVTHTYSIPGHYVPRMILENNSGCRVPIQGIDSIHVHGVTANMRFSADIICHAGPIQFTSNSVSEDSILSYQWYFGDQGASTERNPIHNYTATGLYYPMLVTVTSYGCRDTFRSQVPVKVAESPVATIQQGANACAPASISLTGSISNPDTCSLQWNWNFGNGQTSSLEDPGTIVFTNAGDYKIKLILTNSLGCADTASTTVTAYANPVVDAGRDTFRCFGRNVTLRVSGADSYIWTPSSGLSCTQCSQPDASPDSVITYVVTGTTQHGCTGTDKITVQVAYPFEMRVSPPDTLCLGESLLMYAGGTDSFYWSPAVNPMSPNRTLVNAKPLTSTIYQVTGRDKYNCFSETKEIPVKVYPNPTVDAGNDISIPSGGTAELRPVISNDVTNVTWSPTGSIFRSNLPDISVKPRETTTYLVEVSNQGGCQARDQITVFVTCDGANVFIPNTFSPNHDAMNDVFYVRGKGLFKIRSMRIFNRWGEMVFDRSEVTPNNSNEGWDGTYKGKPLTPDVYVYAIELTCENNGSMLLKGNVALVK